MNAGIEHERAITFFNTRTNPGHGRLFAVPVQTFLVGDERFDHVSVALGFVARFLLSGCSFLIFLSISLDHTFFSCGYREEMQGCVPVNISYLWICIYPQQHE